MDLLRIKCGLAVAVLAALFIAPQPASFAEADAPVQGLLRVMRQDLPILVDNPDLHFDAGDHLPLFQENDKYFVGIWRDEEDVPRLAAFRVVQRGTRRAWVTSDADMYFAYETDSCRGLVYLDLYEELPIIRENRDGYEVLVSRFDREARLWIPRRTRHLEFLAMSPRREAVSVQSVVQAPRKNTNEVIGSISRGGQTFYIYRDPNAPAPILDQAEPTLSSRLGRFWPFSQSQEEEAQIAAPIRATGTAPRTSSGPTPLLDSSRLYTEPVTTAQPAMAGQHLPVETAPKAEPAAPSRLAVMANTLCLALWQHRNILLGLLCVLILAALVHEGLRHRRKSPRPMFRPKPAARPQVETKSAPKAEPAPKAVTTDLAGSLSSMSLGSLAQLLNTESETGILTISDDQKRPVGTMIFIKGEMIDAKTPTLRGTEAVYAIVRQKTGSFSFKRGPGIGSQRTIQESTMPMILDAYRRADESQ